MPRVKVPVPPEESKPVEPVEQPQNLPPTALPTVEPPHRETNHPKNHKLIYIGFTVVLLVMLGVIVNLANSKNDNNKSSDSSSNSQEIKDITAYVGKFYLLPTGETPTIYTVTNVSKVQDKPFFKNAQNGDKVLIYTKSGLAIIYRPSVKKVVNVATVNLNNSSTSSTPSDASSVTAGQ